jgi:hypothetical protein
MWQRVEKLKYTEMGKSSLEEEGMKDDSQWLVRLHLNPLQVTPSVNAQFLAKVMEQPLKPVLLVPRPKPPC